MSGVPQLIMRRASLADLPPLELARGSEIVRHKQGCGMERAWERIIESAFGKHFDFDFLIKAGNFAPEHVLYLVRDGVPVATTTVVENDAYPGEGWYRMVGVHADARGTGAGRTIALAALHDLRARGYDSVRLSTDDRRIPAISLYLSLGFEPFYTHETHKARWEAVMAELADRKLGK